MNYLWPGLIAASYFVGAVPFALIASRRLRGIDIRRYGSGNVGATNALRTLGLGPSAVVFACDFAKGALPTYVGWHVSGSIWVAMACGLAAVVGHSWSIYIRFGGGRGVTTSMGGLAVLLPTALLIAAAVGVLVVAATRYVSLASVLSAIVAPLAAYALYRLGAPFEPTIFALAVCILIVVRHRDNIRRLLAGTESRLGEKAGKPR